MTRGLKAELLKLTTTRGTWGTLIGAVAITIVAFAAPGEAVVSELGNPLHEQQSTFFIGFLSRVLLLVLGIRAITDEWRHGTMTPTLLVTPRRSRFLLQKMLATAAAGAAITTIATATMLLTATIYARMNDIALGPLSIHALAGMALGGALWAAIGVGLGAVLKSQLVATVAGLVWLMGIDDMLRDRLGDLAIYLPGQAGLALVISPNAGTSTRAAVTLGAYALAGLVAGIFLTNRRDVA